jgi:hypothetical protein
MTPKTKTYLLYGAIIATVVAIVVMFRRYIFPERFNDKIDDMTTTGTTETLIYNAAFQRLLRKFNAIQAARLAKLMVAQSKYETAVNGKPYASNVFLKHNNAFGYKYTPVSAYQIGKGGEAPANDAQGNPDGGNYGVYKNVQDSAREVADWIGRGVSAFSQVSTPAQFAQALKTGRPGFAYYGQSAELYAKGVAKFYTV